MNNIQSLISDSIKSLYGVEFSPDISPAPKPELGEYCINVFPIAKTIEKSPNLLAEEVARELAKHTDTFISTSATGGYVNFFLADAVWINMFHEVEKSKSRKVEKSKTIIVDYIGANIGKPLHIGHLCTPSIGQSIINTYRYLGYHVIGDTHVGDWGLFGKLIAAHKLLGRPDGLREKGVEYLLELYIEITARCEADSNVEEYCREEFKKLSEGDEENMKLWGEFTSVSLEAMNRILALIHVFPDYDIGESFYENLPLPKLGNQPPLKYDMDSIVAELIEKKIAVKNEDGSVAVIFPDETKLPSVVIQKKNGTNLYLTADICAIKYRLTNGWNPSKIIYSVDLRQQLHLKQCFEICRMAGWLDDIELFHAGNGHISLPDGAMSTRKGNIIRLEHLVEEAFHRTKKILEEKGRAGEKALGDDDIREIAIGAIKYSYLMQDRERNIVFDWDKALNFEGNSGPYIQYAYVRINKIVLALGNILEKEYLFSKLNLGKYDKMLIQTLYEFESTVNIVGETYKPHHLAQYSYKLANIINTFYVHAGNIVDGLNNSVNTNSPEQLLWIFRGALCKKAAETLKTAFSLLAIEMPSEM